MADYAELVAAWPDGPARNRRPRTSLRTSAAPKTQVGREAGPQVLPQ